MDARIKSGHDKEVEGRHKRLPCFLGRERVRLAANTREVMSKLALGLDPREPSPK
jgi:hypothetical protein